MYDPKLALALAQAANRAYDPHGPDLLADIDSGVSRAIILPFGDDVIVAFRGTEKEQIRQWLADFKAVLVPFVTVTGDKCLVHQGFLEDVGSLMAGIDSALVNHKGRIYVTGHSKGAGEATIYAASRIWVKALYTYGQPRVGNAAFAAAIGKQLAGAYYRVVNDCDLVCRVPEECMDYANSGVLAEFDAHGILSNPAGMVGISIDLVEDVEEHMLPAYLPNLQRMETIAA
ncbi:MAG: lipase family protein [Burkholderiales bacterium]|nr:lipase family protein [Burkholderiales bacterium]